MTLNSSPPPYFWTSLKREYDIAAEHLRHVRPRTLARRHGRSPSRRQLRRPQDKNRPSCPPQRTPTTTSTPTPEHFTASWEQKLWPAPAGRFSLARHAIEAEVRSSRNFGRASMKAASPSSTTACPAQADHHAQEGDLHRRASGGCCARSRLLLGYEVTRDLELTTTTIETPHARKWRRRRLRARSWCSPRSCAPATACSKGMLDLVPAARVAHIGLYRDHETLEAGRVFFKAPSDLARPAGNRRRPDAGDRQFGDRGDRQAQGARSCQAFRFLCLLAAPEGIKRLHHSASRRAGVYTASIDRPAQREGLHRARPGDAGATACTAPNSGDFTAAVYNPLQFRRALNRHKHHAGHAQRPTSRRRPSSLAGRTAALGLVAA